MKTITFKRYIILSAIAAIAPFLLHAQNHYIKTSSTNNPDNIIMNPDECVVQSDKIDFTIQRKWSSSSNTADLLSGTLVGDLDGDGVAEIAVYGSIFNSKQYINIFDGKDGSTVKARIPIPAIQQGGTWRPAMTAVMVDADRNGMGEIIAVCSDNKIISYEADISGGIFKMKPKWTVSLDSEYQAGYGKLPHPNVADLNGDGVPELIIYNQIYNAATGAYLGKTEAIATAYFGKMTLYNSDSSSNLQSIADIDDDGILEIIAGGKVYKPHFNADNTAVTFTILYKNTSIGDGYTSVADVDLDGMLDVVVARRVGGTSTELYVWNPVKGVIVDHFQVASGSIYNGISFPLIGDIDGETDALTGKKYPEICINSAYSLFAYKYNSSTGKYTKKWSLATSDESGASGVTLFDFDNDKVSELVLRDELNLHIIDGSREGDPIVKGTMGCTSATGFEFPTIADVDGDGGANICVTCGYSLVVYESATQPWATTRKVWNQVNYDPLLVNDDLTASTHPIAKNTVFTVNGIDYRPYNGAFIQVPTTDNSMNPVVKSADPFIVNMEVEQYDDVTARVRVVIGNQGQLISNPSLPVSLYINSTESANFIDTKTVGVALLPGSTATLTYSITVAQMKSKLIARVQDDGITFPVPLYNDCNYDNNVMELQKLMAVDDYASPQKNSPVNINILDNDILGACTLEAIGLMLKSNPANGQASLIGNKIKYTPNTGFVGTDSFTYKIVCGAQESTAAVHIIVNSTLMVEAVDSAAEPDNPGVFRIKYTDSGFTFSKDLKIHYAISSTADSGDYTTNPATGVAILQKDTPYVDITITPNNNFKVEGNSRSVTLTIASVSIEP